MKNFTLTSIVLLLVACRQVDQSKLAGQWQATHFYESGQTVNMSLDAVKMTFTPTGGYTFQSIGFYEEKGHFEVVGTHLVLTDTTKGGARKQRIKVDWQDENILKLAMENGGKSQHLFLEKR